MKFLKKPEALAVVVSVGALVVSLFEPMKDWLSKPDISIGLPPFIDIGTAGGLGVPLVTPMVSIVNLGSAIGEFSRVECALENGLTQIKMLAPSIDLSDVNPAAPVSPIVANPLKPGERFLNKVNCMSMAGLARQSVAAHLTKRAQTEVSRMDGFNCAAQSDENAPELSRALSRELEKFWAENFTIEPGEYTFSVSVYAKGKELLSSDKKSITITQSDIAIMRSQQELLRKGFGTVCPFGFYGRVAIGLE